MGGILLVGYRQLPETFGKSMGFVHSLLQMGNEELPEGIRSEYTQKHRKSEDFRCFVSEKIEKR